jgi:hypothetical protein
MIIRRLCGLALALLVAGAAHAQTLTDHVMMKRKDLLAGFLYSYDRWDEYWEGGLKRTNGNIGTLSTRTATFYADYGITDRLNVLLFVPYVWTEASQGTLAAMDDFQDLSVGVKYRLTENQLDWGTLRSFAILSVGTPISDYTPDLLPLSIGLQADSFTGRALVNLMRPDGFFASASFGYTVRDDVELDRTFYFTNGRGFITNQMDMPSVADWGGTIGYQKGQLYIPATIWHQDTRGGGDIRRQDQPYASNNFDFTRLGLAVVYLPRQLRDMMFRVEVDRIVSGRNVGQSDTFTAGVFRNFHF